MTDDLFTTMLQRAMAKQSIAPSEQGPPETPVIPPNVPRRLPTKLKRFDHAQTIQNAYRNGWSPNPVLLQADLVTK